MKIIQYKLEAYINNLGFEYWDITYQGQAPGHRCRPGGPSVIDTSCEEYGYMIERLYGPNSMFRDGSEH